MIKSNIGIKSNIYIRSDSILKKDKQYVEKITGARRLAQIQGQQGFFDRVKLTEVQKEIASKTVICSKAKNGEMSYGPVMVNGSLQWVNRCEYTACLSYKTCTANRSLKIILRSVREENEAEDPESLHEFLKALGIVISDNAVEFKKDKNTAKIEESPKTYTPPKEQTAEEIKTASRKYTEITEPSRIISAPINSHIVLNSGPGTGKTYTIIRRLIYILSNNLCPAERIYILCYTRSAKKVIETKLEQAVADGIIPPSAENICILTFDRMHLIFLQL